MDIVSKMDEAVEKSLNEYRQGRTPSKTVFAAGDVIPMVNEDKHKHIEVNTVVDVAGQSAKESTYNVTVVNRTSGERKTHYGVTDTQLREKGFE